MVMKALHEIIRFGAELLDEHVVLLPVYRLISSFIASICWTLYVQTGFKTFFQINTLSCKVT